MKENDPVCQICMGETFFEYAMGVWEHVPDITSDCSETPPLALYWPRYPKASIEVRPPTPISVPR